jgi:hypothetical protein
MYILIFEKLNTPSFLVRGVLDPVCIYVFVNVFIYVYIYMYLCVRLFIRANNCDV